MPVACCLMQGKEAAAVLGSSSGSGSNILMLELGIVPVQLPKRSWGIQPELGWSLPIIQSGQLFISGGSVRGENRSRYNHVASSPCNLSQLLLRFANFLVSSLRAGDLAQKIGLE